MRRDATLARLVTERLVVVARGLAREQAVPVADALLAADVCALEITLDAPDALTIIAELAERFGERLLLGAGTVMSADDARLAMDAGASYIVSPVFLPPVVDACAAAGIPCAPGALTPSEIYRVLQSGAPMVKIFPAGSVTPAYIRDLMGPFGTRRPVFMLTGGLDAGQIPAYLAAGVSIIGVGGAILARDALAAGAYGEITERARAIRSVIPGTGE